MKLNTLFIAYFTGSVKDHLGFTERTEDVLTFKDEAEVLRFIVNAASPDSGIEVEKIYKFTPIQDGHSSLMEVAYEKGKFKLKLAVSEGQFT